MKIETDNMYCEDPSHRFTDDRAKDKSLNRLQNRHSPTFMPTGNSLTRAYLRDLRAAEMTAWEMTGGDCLLSSRAMQVCALTANLFGKR